MNDSKIRWEEKAPGFHCGYLPSKEQFSCTIQVLRDETYRLHESELSSTGGFFIVDFKDLETAKLYAEWRMGDADMLAFSGYPLEITSAFRAMVDSRGEQLVKGLRPRELRAMYYLIQVKIGERCIGIGEGKCQN